MQENAPAPADDAMMQNHEPPQGNPTYQQGCSGPKMEWEKRRKEKKKEA